MAQLPKNLKKKIEIFSSMPSWNCVIRTTDTYTAVSLTTNTGIMWSIVRDVDIPELKERKIAMLTEYINMSLQKVGK